DDLLKSLIVDGGTTTFGYDADSRLTSTILPSGVVESRNYTASGRLAGISDKRGATTLSSYSYSYDAVANPTAATVNDQTNTDSYNSDERLTEVCYGAGSCPDGELAWTYDPEGDRLTQTDSV